MSVPPAPNHPQEHTAKAQQDHRLHEEPPGRFPLKEPVAEQGRQPGRIHLRGESLFDPGPALQLRFAGHPERKHVALPQQLPGWDGQHIVLVRQFVLELLDGFLPQLFLV